MNQFTEFLETAAAKLPHSNALLDRAKNVLVSPLVTGPYRAPANVNFVDRASGSRVWDVDGNEFIDVTMGYGPLILGHAHPVAIEAAQAAIAKGTTYAIANPYEVEMAELMVDAIPCAERVVFCNSGTEATMHAIKIARATTGRTKIATFEGSYHGVHDYAQVGGTLSACHGSAEMPESHADTKGIPETVAQGVVKLAFDCDASLERIRELKDELAVVIIEPVPSGYPVNMKEFLTKLRQVTQECGVLLMFDEVISGFRCAYGGAQEKYGLVPDMATYGKIIGGGFPAGAVTGSKAALASVISSGDAGQDIAEGKVFMVGTFSGNPVTMQVGAAVLKHLRDNPSVYEHIDGMAQRVKDELHAFALDHQMPFKLIGENSWFIPYMGDRAFSQFRDNHDKNHAQRNVVFCNLMREEGIYFPDLHTVFFSSAHSQEDADFFIEKAKKSLLIMRDLGLM